MPPAAYKNDFHVCEVISSKDLISVGEVGADVALVSVWERPDGLGCSKKISLPKTGSFPPVAIRPHGQGREKHQVWEVLISGTT
jgi:hypothetical protein